jgi:hypothetical protein
MDKVDKVINFTRKFVSLTETYKVLVKTDGSVMWHNYCILLTVYGDFWFRIFPTPHKFIGQRWQTAYVLWKWTWKYAMHHKFFVSIINSLKIVPILFLIGHIKFCERKNIRFTNVYSSTICDKVYIINRR